MSEQPYPRRAVLMARGLFIAGGAVVLIAGVAIIAKATDLNWVGVVVALVGGAVLGFGVVAPARTCGNVGNYLMSLTGV